MFKNREVRMTLAKKDDGEPQTSTLEIHPDTLANAGELAKDIMRESTKLIAILIAADTARRVIVALAEK